MDYGSTSRKHAFVELEPALVRLLSSDCKVRITAWRETFCKHRPQDFIPQDTMALYMRALPLTIEMMTKQFLHEGVLFASTRFYRSVCQGHTHFTRKLSSPQLPRAVRAETEEYLTRLSLFMQRLIDTLGQLLSDAITAIESNIAQGIDPNPASSIYQAAVGSCQLIQHFSEAVHAMSHFPTYLFLRQNAKTTVRTALAGIPSLSADPVGVHSRGREKTERLVSALGFHVRSTCPSVRQLADNPVMLAAPPDHPMRASDDIYQGTARFPVQIRALHFVPVLTSLLHAQRLPDKRLAAAIMAATLSLPPKCTPGVIPSDTLKTVVADITGIDSSLPRIAGTAAAQLTALLLTISAGYVSDPIAVLGSLADSLNLTVDLDDTDPTTPQPLINALHSAVVTSVVKGVGVLVGDPTAGPIYGRVLTLLHLIDVYGMTGPSRPLLSELFAARCRQLFDTARSMPSTYVYAPTSIESQSELLETGLATHGDRDGDDLDHSQFLGLWASVRAAYMAVVSAQWSQYAGMSPADLMECIPPLLEACRDSFHPALVDTLARAAGDFVFVVLAHAGIEETAIHEERQMKRKRVNKTLTDAHLNAFRTPSSRDVRLHGQTGSDAGTAPRLHSETRTLSRASSTASMIEAVKPILASRKAVRDLVHTALLAVIGGATYSGKRGGGIPIAMAQIISAEFRAVSAGFGKAVPVSWGQLSLRDQSQYCADTYPITFSLWRWLEHFMPADVRSTPLPQQVKWDTDMSPPQGIDCNAATVTLLNMAETALQNADLRAMLTPFHERLLLLALQTSGHPSFILRNAACSALKWISPQILYPGITFPAMEKRWPRFTKEALTALRTCPAGFTPVAALLLLGTLSRHTSAPTDSYVPTDMVIDLLAHPRIHIRSLTAKALPALLTTSQWAVILQQMARSLRVACPRNALHGSILTGISALGETKVVEAALPRLYPMLPGIIALGIDSACPVVTPAALTLTLKALVKGKPTPETVNAVVKAVVERLSKHRSVVLWDILLQCLKKPSAETIEIVHKTCGLRGAPSYDAVAIALLTDGLNDLVLTESGFGFPRTDESAEIGLTLIRNEVPFQLFANAGLDTHPRVLERLAVLKCPSVLTIESLPPDPTPKHLDAVLDTVLGSDPTDTSMLSVFTLAGQLVNFGLYGGSGGVARIELLATIHRRLEQLPIRADELIGSIEQTVLDLALSIETPTPAIVHSLASVFHLSTPLVPQLIKRLRAQMIEEMALDT
ncbi:hypothetical protein J8273_6715 [Carpediemonas membranifera]|uniref:Uncharacterized protein n=1 Tax=Carpediemonas membranifera TaxID=201153 RepID=A0A8J6BW20_9EUKA|nr:hypothetical protein J8273_6715 [Carpediemonas membranifera]|eukprot:KAG9391986.1 hypothetical protein J8273_6715 [Carpediemonas membranifera]